MDEAKMVSAEEAQALLDGVRGGLWTAVALDGDRYEIVGDDDAHIASVEDDEGDDEFLASDNADLIAAAPALARTVVALHAQLATARREGAEAMRERVKAICAENIELVEGVMGMRDVSTTSGAVLCASDQSELRGIRRIAREVDALPTDGEVPRWNASARREGVRRKVFVSSLADIFEDHPDVAPWRADALALLERCTALDVQLLTKRPENIMRMVPAHWHTAWPAHVWIGTTVEDQRRAEERIPHLLRVPARVRFLSCEPLLEAVDLDAALSVTDRHGEPSGPRCNADGSPALSWVIVGGESGPGARPFDLAWARSIVAQCREAGVPVFVKQMGDNPILSPGPITWPSSARAGADPAEWPADLRVQHFPEAP